MQRYRQALADRPVLYTARLQLRRPGEQDLAAIVAIVGDWEVANRLARVPYPYGEADARFFLNTVVPSELTWVIVERCSRQVVGAMGLALHEHPVERVELGYYVARKHWGRGIATEAGSAILAYGIGLVGKDRITSGYFR